MIKNTSPQWPSITLNIVWVLFMLFLFSCDALNVRYETFYIYPEDTAKLEWPADAKIAELIADTSVGTFKKIGDRSFFVPINFGIRVSNVGKYRVPIGDLVITDDVNNYNPIEFSSKEQGLSMDRNTYLFFLPTTDSLAITKEKLKNQKADIDYIDHNSLIAKGNVIFYTYNKTLKGFEVFHSSKILAFTGLTKTEILYEAIDILRMAKHLKDTVATELNWDKLDYVVPLHFPRYYGNGIMDTIVENTELQPNNFQYRYHSDNLGFQLTVVKDSSLFLLLADLKKVPLKEDYDIEKNFSKESIRILDDYLECYSSEIVIYKKENNTFYFSSFFDDFVLVFIPEKNYLFTIDGDFNGYNDEIFMRYFNQVLLPRLVLLQ